MDMLKVREKQMIAKIETHKDEMRRLKDKVSP